jgi:hypothetical protein
LREYDPKNFATKLDWHWARYHANCEQRLGFDSLALLQAVAAATTDPDCNPSFDHQLVRMVQRAAVMKPDGRSVS